MLHTVLSSGIIHSHWHTESAWTASATVHHLRTIQTIVENVYVWLVGPRRPVSER